MSELVEVATRELGKTVEHFNCTGLKSEKTIQIGLAEARIGVGLRNNWADCMEPWVFYNITEGADLIGNISTISGGGVNVGSAACLARQEWASWALFFLPRALGKVVIVLEFEGRYIEWGEPKVYRPPKREIVLRIIPREEPGYLGALIVVAILTTGVLAAGIVIHTRRKKPSRSQVIGESPFLDIHDQTLQFGLRQASLNGDSEIR